ncbi:MAG: 1-deoxy-D-xylulose-5-phosphate reductoisomerase [Sporolactobacillus sp.]
MKTISLLGATGSVGMQTLQVIREHPDKFAVAAFAFGSNSDKALPLIREFKPNLVAVKDQATADKLAFELGDSVRIVSGMQGMIEAAVFEKSDTFVNAVLGSIGLEPTLSAIDAGKTIALANKETLVTAGHLVMARAKRAGAAILPVDSEHSAIFQSMQGQDKARITRLILTASGGSFRDKTREQLKDVTVQQALCHPNWSMGKKITVDSATLMNKGLEVIEAHWLFDMPFNQIDILIHRESIIHSLVEYADHSQIAQLGMPSMLVPIQYALTYPKRLELKQTKRLNLWEMGALHFQKVDEERFPCIRLAYSAGRAGGSYPTVLNAANEVAVQAFLNGIIRFLDIEACVKDALDAHQRNEASSLEAIETTDRWAREFVTRQIMHH